MRGREWRTIQAELLVILYAIFSEDRQPEQDRNEQFLPVQCSTRAEHVHMRVGRRRSVWTCTTVDIVRDTGQMRG